MSHKKVQSRGMEPDKITIKMQEQVVYISTCEEIAIKKFQNRFKKVYNPSYVSPIEDANIIGGNQEIKA